MRKWVWEAVKGVPDLTVPEARIMSSGAAGEMGDAPDKPFIIIRFGTEQPVLGMPASANTIEVPFDVWVHDSPGSMVTNIDQNLALLRYVLPTLAPAQSASGVRILDLRWESDSNDLYDDGYKTNTRYGSYRVTGRR